MANQPPQMPTMMPHLILKDVDKTIDFYKTALGAVEVCRMNIPGTNQLMHGTIMIGDAMIMLAGESNDCPGMMKAPVSLGGTSVTIHLNVENADATFHKALAAGAESLMTPQDMFWGDRYGKFKDPSGHEWSIAHKVQELTPQQIEANMKECFAAPAR